MSEIKEMVIESLDNRIDTANAERLIAQADAIDKARLKDPTSTLAKESLPAPRVIIDVWKAIMDDSWENITIHGKPRTSLSTWGRADRKDNLPNGYSICSLQRLG